MNSLVHQKNVKQFNSMIDSYEKKLDEKVNQMFNHVIINQCRLSICHVILTMRVYLSSKTKGYQVNIQIIFIVAIKEKVGLILLDPPPLLSIQIYQMYSKTLRLIIYSRHSKVKQRSSKKIRKVKVLFPYLLVKDPSEIKVTLNRD